MISLKVLSAAAAMALVLPMVVPSAGFAQNSIQKGYGGGVRAGGGGGGGAPRMGAGPQMGGGGGGGGYYRGGGGGGFIPGAVAGAIIGGAIASGGGYYGGPTYAPAYAPGYYDEGYDDGAVAVAQDPGGDDSVGYCMQRFRSYDPRSGTYLGNDGYRHPCP